MPRMKKQRILGTVSLIFALIIFELDRSGDLVLVSGALLGLGVSLFFIPLTKKAL
ncbi:hypothetical protein SAMN04487907_104138 [Zunongwangia mangrovi]|uniref:Uncharacterized protein n=1 Tax=Zunongwangia mangrovi TaxID=1334022 RepID=A0A1I1J2V3_9FLAO|nr:hypothetical protein SAMN04487907_104138 [Zunongwangia mangrovi]|tara:strand:- start:1461 stop:1625 length:165 start_codon:yes stop_codon:yes gene_type:complete